MTNAQAARVIGELIELIDPQGKVRAFLSEEDIEALRHAIAVLQPPKKPRCAKPISKHLYCTRKEGHEGGCSFDPCLVD